MSDIIKEIQNMVLTSPLTWPDTVYVKEKGNLLLLNYRPEVQYKNLWTDFETVCRGLIINRETGEIVARPFDKFFNWDERGRVTGARISRVLEKMDGSLGIHYREGDKHMVATRGSFDGDQALWATEYLNRNHPLKGFPVEWTLLFEIIYPQNKIVIDYGGWSGLALLAIRNRLTGKYLSEDVVNNVAHAIGFRLPEQYSFSSPHEIIKAAEVLIGNEEGWVAEFMDGQRFKFKGGEYLKLHKLISGLTFKSILEHHQAGTIDQVKKVLPDEFHEEIDEWVKYIDTTLLTTAERIAHAYSSAPKSSRKRYAIWVQEQEPDLMKYMFARLDGKGVLSLIYKYAFKEGRGKGF